MQEVLLTEILDAREQRALVQQSLLRQYAVPVISFSMNIPGPVKDTPLIRRAFSEGRARLADALRAAGLAVLHREEKREKTGCELLWAVDAGAEQLKALCQGIEQRDRLGRLFDMDVIDRSGKKIDRAVPRCCIICGRPGPACASRRVHSVPELQQAVRRIITEHFLQKDRERLTVLATGALLEEVDTTPKPGLVDRANNGSHRDMTRSSFYRSAAALRSYWGRCFDLGHQYAAAPPKDCFALLRQAGREAEVQMLRATFGVNTHKGAIFTLGLVCAAVGRLWSAEAPCRDAQAIASAAALLCADAVADDFSRLRRAQQAHTAGERLYLQYGLTGVRGEAAAGLPGVTASSLPAFRRALAEGYDRNGAGVLALLTLIARGTDSNMIARGGAERAAQASAVARAAAQALRPDDLSAAEALDRQFIAQNLSPGGCADLLAVTYFLHDWQSEPEPG